MSIVYWAKYWADKFGDKYVLNKPDTILTNIFCCYCEMPILLKSQLTKEHLVPRSTGGNNTSENKRDCCKKCNGERGNKDLNEWAKELKDKFVATANRDAQELLNRKCENVESLARYIEEKGSALYRANELYSGAKISG